MLEPEKAQLEARKFIKDDEKVKKLMDQAIKGTVEKISDLYAEQMKEQYIELFALAADVIKSQPEDERARFVSESLPKTGQDLLKIIEAEEQDKLNNTQK